MNIAFYNPTNVSFMSGPEVWLFEMCSRLVDLNIKVTIITTKYNRKNNYKKIYRSFEDNGVKIIELNNFQLPLSGSAIPIDLYKYINNKFDYIYMFNGFAFQDLLIFLANKIFFRSKLIYGIHAPIKTEYFLHNLYQNIVSKNIIRLSNKIHVLNLSDKNLLNEVNKNVFLIGSGIDYNKNKSFLDFKTKLEVRKCNIVFLGRLDEQKNIANLLKVIEYFKNDNDIHFYIAGKGEYVSNVKSLEEKQNNLTYLGFVKNSDLGLLYKDKHYLINLSKYETFCLVVLEALSFGLPVIATKTEGICSDYGNDTLLKPIKIDFSVKDVVIAIEECKDLYLNRKKKYKQYCDLALKKASNFDWDVQVSKFINNLL